MNILDSLSAAISWLDRQGGFTQAVVSALVLAAGGAVWSLASRAFRIARERRQRRGLEAKELARALEADFMSEPAELGEVDHGVNTTATLESIQVLLYEALPPLTAIIQNLFKDTLDKLPSKGEASDPRRKQAVLRTAAKEIHPQVRALEGVAQRIAPESKAFISAYRALLAKPELSPRDKDALLTLRETYRTGVASTFGQVSDLVAERRKSIAKLDGKQQDLSRVVRRSVRALRDIETAVRAVSTFCAGEMSKTIERLVRA